MSQQNWRIESDATDYFTHRKKEFEVADRRPVVRKPSDLAGMGPGIGANAVPIIDFNDLLATYDGFYSASRAVNGPEPIEDVLSPDFGYDVNLYAGTVVSDAELGGVQKFTDIVSGESWHRAFRRAPSDETYIVWGPWVSTSASLRPIGEVTMLWGDSVPYGWLRMDGSTFDALAYPALAEYLGTNVLPNMTDRFPVGPSPTKPGRSTGGDAPTLVPEHQHEVGQHSHSISEAGTQSATIPNGNGENGSTTITFANGGHAHTGSTGSSDPNVKAGIESSEEIKIIPKFMAMNFIMRAI